MSDDYMDAHLKRPMYAPSKLYVWIVSQDGEHRIRKWDVKPFDEANYICDAVEDLQAKDAEIARMEGAIKTAMIMIGARTDSMTDVEKQVSVNQAWHVLDQALQRTEAGDVRS